jgi:2-amino-4-hydroxy-6-hydroxymethyldihydropteridine diphosphokinase
MPLDTASYHYAVGVGSNLGDRAGILAAAMRLVDESGAARVEARSPLIETMPLLPPDWTGPAPDRYLNGAWIVATNLGPHQLLHLLQGVEDRLGRTRERQWGPRTCDLDLLLREDGLMVSTPVLTLPHPRLHQRSFAVVPLSRIAPGWIVPPTGKTVGELAASLIS